MNTELTYTLPAYQTAAGGVDILSHIMERYFTNEEDCELTDRQCEALMKTVIKQLPVVMEKPEDYAARAEVMWAGTMAHNGVLGVGRVEMCIRDRDYNDMFYRTGNSCKNQRYYHGNAPRSIERYLSLIHIYRCRYGSRRCVVSL